MKTLMKPLLRALALLALIFVPNLASAYYDPGVQRWINRDPINENGGVGLYVLAGNSPVIHVDAEGLKPPWLPPLPPLPPWFPGKPFPYPLPNWPGATLMQRLAQCIKDCDTDYQSAIQGCFDLYIGDPCPFTNPILRGLDRAVRYIDYALCCAPPGAIHKACVANCRARYLSPWN
jgi:hypothetical protein